MKIFNSTQSHGFADDGFLFGIHVLKYHVNSLLPNSLPIRLLLPLASLRLRRLPPLGTYVGIHLLHCYIP
jgi:hypothetical protein